MIARYGTPPNYKNGHGKTPIDLMLAEFDRAGRQVNNLVYTYSVNGPNRVRFDFDADAPASLEHRGTIRENLRWLKNHGFKFETKTYGFDLVLPPAAPAPVAEGASVRTRALAILERPARVWQALDDEARDSLEVPNDARDFREAALLSENMQQLERAGWQVITHRSGTTSYAAFDYGPRPVNPVTRYVVKPPVEVEPPRDFCEAIARALKSTQTRESWAKRGEALAGGKVRFEQDREGWAYSAAMRHTPRLLAQGWSVQQFCGVRNAVEIAPPAGLIEAA